MTEQLRGDLSDNQSVMILQMENKLNKQTFLRRLMRTDNHAALSTQQYWDWLTYVDVISDSGILYYRMTT